MTEHEDYWRGVKVGKLLDVLAAQHATADEVEALDATGKRAAERLAGVNPASERTWTAVLGTLRGREQARERAEKDPFAGLPKGNV